MNDINESNLSKNGEDSEKCIDRKYNLPACLIIMDGFGLAAPGDGNAISIADTPCLDYLLNYTPNLSLSASGQAVGLPAGQMGNSEVGHLNIGAGRIVPQELMRINDACDSGTLLNNEVLLSCFDDVKKNDSVLHFMGLLSDGGVHSSNKHLYALVSMAKQSQVKKVCIHCFMDGRDVSPTSGVGFISELQQFLDDINDDNFSASIASISGRYYAMDRDNRWGRVQRAYDAIVLGNKASAGECATVCDGVRDGAHGGARENLHDSENMSFASATQTPTDVVQALYGAGTTDEFIEPVAFSDRGVCDGDGVVFFNFRPDRARQLTRAFIEGCGTGFDSECFKRDYLPKVHFVCLTEYDATFTSPVAFPKVFPKNVLADVLADEGLLQYHIAETEKYAHVTFFFNGGVERPKRGEVRKLISSPKVATYDLKPEMSAPEVTKTLVEAIDSDAADVYIVNFANCDMVGHTGSLSAAISAVEEVDCSVAKVLGAIERRGGVALVTADHGNADKMLDCAGCAYTAHTTNPVPLVLVDYTSNNFKFAKNGAQCETDPNTADQNATTQSATNQYTTNQNAAPQNRENKTSHNLGTQGALCDIAPTLLDMIGIPIPKEMTGKSLLDK